jgi:hypothetical protein
VWIRGLDAGAPLSRYASWLFLAAAGCAAAVAAFSPGLAFGILTALAAVVTVGAVLVAKGLESATRLLAGAAFIAFGATLIGPRVIVARARETAEWAIKAPRS